MKLFRNVKTVNGIELFERHGRCYVKKSKV